MADKVTETKVITPEVCPCCGKDLGGVAGRKKETRYVMEIPRVRPTVTAIVAEEKICPECGQRTVVEFPAEAGGSQQYGPNLKALIVLLSESGMVAMKRVSEILEAILGMKLSEGTIANTLSECAAKLRKPVWELKDAIKEAKVAHFDETGMRSEGKLKWLHTASTGLLTYLELKRKRGKEAMDEIGVLSDFKGLAMHDALASYWNYSCKHALCNAHLLRELDYLDENTGQEWPKEMMLLLLEIKRTVDDRREAGETLLPEAVLQKFANRYDCLVKDGLSLNPEQTERTGRRGRIKQTKTRLLLLRLKEHKDEYLRFATDFRAPFDNNQAERDFRMAKVKQKVSGCFRSENGGKNFATIFSFIQTIKKNGFTVFDELVNVFKGNYYFPFQLATE
jgi:transposase